MGTSNISSNVAMAGTLAVTGAATLSSTLGVTGAVALSSTLGVTGAVALSSTLGVTGATTLTGVLTANGAVTLARPSTATKQLAIKTLLLGGRTSTQSGFYNFAYADGTNRPSFNSLKLYDIGTNTLRTVYLANGSLCIG